jgi:hypothetical protein
MTSNAIRKKEINFKRLNSKNNGYIYGIYNIIEHVFVFGLY